MARPNRLPALPPTPPPCHDAQVNTNAAAANQAALDSELLAREAARLGFVLSAEMLATFERYAAELLLANERLNLTRLTRPDEIAIQLLLDSLVCLWGVPDELAAPDGALLCVDLGTGAGLPGLALAVVRPAWQVTLADSVGKKVAFVAQVGALLGLTNTESVHARAEDLGHDSARRERYDLAVARAVAPLVTLVEYLLPLVRVGGRALALKGADVATELATAQVAIDVLGGTLVEARPYELPGLDQARHLVIIEKLRATPAAYARQAGVPAERPIGAPRRA
jgi:16S rRNA (guanine527-N7)-methyltransferase